MNSKIMSMSSWPMAPNELSSKFIVGSTDCTHFAMYGPWEVVSELGTGNYCHVYEAVLNIEKRANIEGGTKPRMGYAEYEALGIVRGRAYAVKVINTEQCRRLKKEKDVLVERHVLGRLRDELIAKKYQNKPQLAPVPRLYHASRDGTGLFVITECFRGGEVYDYIADIGIVNQAWLKGLMAQVVLALEDLHSLGVCHRDLKCENLVFKVGGGKSRPRAIALIDFGTARDFRHPSVEGAGNTGSSLRSKTFTHWVGSPNFMSPEQVENQASDLRSDLWGLGCLFAQLATGHAPFRAPGEYPTYLKITNLICIDFENDLDPVLVDLIKKLIKKEPNDRLGAIPGTEDITDFSEIKAHPWFEGVPWVLEELLEYCELKTDPLHYRLSKKLAKKLYIEPPEHDKKVPVDLIYRPDDVEALWKRINACYLSDKRWKTECAQCHSCRGPEYPWDPTEEDNSEAILASLKRASCLDCRSNTPDDVGQVTDYLCCFLRIEANSAHRQWRDMDREDGFFKELVEEHLAESDSNASSDDGKTTDPVVLTSDGE